MIGLTNKNSYQSAVLVLLPLSPVQKGCGGGKQKVLGGSVRLLHTPAGDVGTLEQVLVLSLHLQQ